MSEKASSRENRNIPPRQVSFETPDGFLTRVQQRIVQPDGSPFIDTRERYRTATRYRTEYLSTRESAWWLKLEHTNRNFDIDFFVDSKPTEQFIIGQGSKNIRFFNYADTELLEENVADCIQFVDTITQFFGNQAYEQLTDVVIAPMRGREHGFVFSNMLGVTFIDSRLLGPEAIELGEKNNTSESDFLYVMLHEFGHQLHGFGYEKIEKLLQFAEQIGWDTEGLQIQAPLWQIRDERVGEFAPADDVMVRLQDGSMLRVTEDDYLENYEERFDDQGAVVRKRAPFYFLGSPTDYGKMNPKESYAETTAQAILGDYVVWHMSETRDAWLDHAASHGPLATPLNRAPITVTQRKGEAISYPIAELPDVIYAAERE